MSLLLLSKHKGFALHVLEKQNKETLVIIHKCKQKQVALLFYRISIEHSLSMPGI
jgi:hypothetical protein